MIAMIAREIGIENATATATENPPATTTETETEIDQETTVANKIEIETGCEIPACIGMCLGCRTVCLAGNILSASLLSGISFTKNFVTAGVRVLGASL